MRVQLALTQEEVKDLNKYVEYMRINTGSTRGSALSFATVRGATIIDSLVKTKMSFYDLTAPKYGGPRKAGLSFNMGDEDFNTLVALKDSLSRLCEEEQSLNSVILYCLRIGAKSWDSYYGLGIY